MIAGSLRDWTLDTLHHARERTKIGQMLNSAGEGSAIQPDISDPARLVEFLNFALVSLDALNEIVVKLAAEVDNLRDT